MSDVSTAPAAVDVAWLGRPGCIAVWRVGDNLIDCGPTTALPGLLEALGDWRPRRLILTHIHFDHAGAAGVLAQRWPDLEVYVHRRGAHHMASPERLESSARRVFGEAFDALFGTLQPIPEQRLHPLDGGETIGGLQIAYTPGHASHHVCMLDESGFAFVGDVAGVRLEAGEPVFAPSRRRTSTSTSGCSRSRSSPSGSPRSWGSPTTASSTTRRRTSPRSPTTSTTRPS